MKKPKFPEKIYNALATEKERHRLTVIAIKRGWQNRKKLAEAFGMSKIGAPYDQGLISGVLNARRSPGIARELERFMQDNNGPDLIDITDYSEKQE